LGLTGSRVVAVNRAIAIANCRGAFVGLTALATAAEGGGLETFQAYWAAKAELEARLELAEADDSYARAIGLEVDPAVRTFLTERRQAARVIEVKNRPSTPT
jgi:RNA polymerase sigma-70 factor (ECF subfamily)